MQRVIAIMVIGTVDKQVGARELKAFVDDALSSWGGQFHPDDPLFESIDVRSVTIKHIGNVKHDAD